MQRHLIVAGVLALAATSAMARQGLPEDINYGNMQAAPIDFQARDNNVDGYISLLEAASSDQRLTERFDQLDQNGDGRLSVAEYLGGEGRPAGRDAS